MNKDEKPKERERCGAKRKNGKPCRQYPMRGKTRCRLHGGLSTGPPKNNKNSWKYGIYAQGIKDEEKELYEQIKVGTLDDDIKIIKLQLARAVKAQKEFEESVAAGNADKLAYEPHEIKAKSHTKNVTSELDGKPGYERTETIKDKEVTKKHPDYRKIIFQLSGRIAKLELTRSAIMTEGGDDIDWTEIGFEAAKAADLFTDTASGTNSA